MLALTRKKGESLVINNNIEITVLEIRGDQVKIGISAPKEVPVSALENPIAMMFTSRFRMRTRRH